MSPGTLSSFKGPASPRSFRVGTGHPSLTLLCLAWALGLVSQGNSGHPSVPVLLSHSYVCSRPPPNHPSALPHQFSHSSHHTSLASPSQPPGFRQPSSLAAFSSGALTNLVLVLSKRALSWGGSSGGLGLSHLCSASSLATPQAPSADILDTSIKSWPGRLGILWE